MRLVKGKGGPQQGACWMSAIHYYANADRSGFTWSDQPGCVCATIRPLAITLNDLCDDGEREALIGPHLFAPVGTATLDCDLMRRRAYRCADAALRSFVPLAMDAAGLKGAAATLRACAPIVDEATARAGYEAAESAARAESAASAACAACSASAAGAARAEIKRLLLDLILELCAMGERAEVVPCRTQEQTIQEVCR